MKNIRLIINEADKSKGGIPRYGYHILDNHTGEVIDFTDFKQNRNPVRKVWNNLIGRELFAERQSSDEEKINHFIQPELYTPNLPGKDIVTIHDLFIFRDDQYNGFYGRGRKYFFTKRLWKAVENCDRFIAVSQQTKDKCVKELGIDRDKIEVINLGIRDKFHRKSDVKAEQRKIGYLGDARGRKRVPKLVKDWNSSFDYTEELHRPVYHSDAQFKLELCGTAGEQSYGGDAERADIKLRGFIPEDELVDWYNEIEVLFMPSEVEGFGLPILEAAACGTPTFVYKDAEISEELEPFITRVSSVSEVENKLEEFTEEDIEKIVEETEGLSWGKTVDQHREVYARWI